MQSPTELCDLPEFPDLSEHLFPLIVRFQSAESTQCPVQSKAFVSSSVVVIQVPFQHLEG